MPQDEALRQSFILLFHVNNIARFGKSKQAASGQRLYSSKGESSRSYKYIIHLVRRPNAVGHPVRKTPSEPHSLLVGEPLEPAAIVSLRRAAANRAAVGTQGPAIGFAPPSRSRQSHCLWRSSCSELCDQEGQSSFQGVLAREPVEQEDTVELFELLALETDRYKGRWKRGAGSS